MIRIRSKLLKVSVRALFVLDCLITEMPSSKGTPRARKDRGKDERPFCDCTAVLVGAVIVSVEVAEFSPGSVIEEGESAQAGIGVGPATAQESWMSLSNKPFCGVMVTTSVPCAPG